MQWSGKNDSDIVLFHFELFLVFHKQKCFCIQLRDLGALFDVLFWMQSCCFCGNSCNSSRNEWLFKHCSVIKKKKLSKIEMVWSDSGLSNHTGLTRGKEANFFIEYFNSSLTHVARLPLALEAALVRPDSKVATLLGNQWDSRRTGKVNWHLCGQVPGETH